MDPKLVKYEIIQRGVIYYALFKIPLDGHPDSPSKVEGAEECVCGRRNARGDVLTRAEGGILYVRIRLCAVCMFDVIAAQRQEAYESALRIADEKADSTDKFNKGATFRPFRLKPRKGTQADLIGDDSYDGFRQLFIL